VKARPGPWLEISASILASPLVFAGRGRGALLYFALLAALAGRGALAELAAPLGHLARRDPE
jgi:hypothetical protein